MSAQDFLVVAELQRNVLDDVTLELLAAARELAAATGGQVICAVLSAEGASHTAALAAADRILLVDDPLLAAYAPKPFLESLRQLVADEQPRAVLVAATSVGWDLAPLLASGLSAPLVTGCTAATLDGDALVATVSFCGGKMMAEVQVDASPAVLMLLPGSYRAATEGGAAQVETRSPAAPLTAGEVTFQEWVLPEAGDVDITSQDTLVAVGRGIQQEDNIELAEELAEALHGAVCASRPVVDQGWLPATRQVGKSGMKVKPKLYLALGISGAPEHVEGMQGADLIIAVNTDPQAPIFDAADFGAEVDVLDLLPALIEAVNGKKG